MDHPVQWTTASPLWSDLVGSADPASWGAFHQPALLRFTSDTFMEDFLALVQTDPTQLKGLLVRPETWRALAPLPVPVTPPPKFALALNRLRLAKQSNGAVPAVTTVVAPTSGPLKLYQPSHQRYYLLAACLVCQMPGLPDRTLNTAAEEQVSFVVRRLLPRPGATYSTSDIDAANCDEYAYITSGSAQGWQMVTGATVPSAGVAVTGEERLPLFPVSFIGADGRNRRLFSALVPVGKRETYLGAPLSAASGGPAPSPASPAVNPRLALLMAQVIEPWRNLIQRALAVRAILKPVTPPSPPPTQQQQDDLLNSARNQIQTVSWYILLDFAKYLQTYLPDVSAAVNDPGQAGTLSAASQAVYSWLTSQVIGTDVGLTTGVVGAPDGVATSLAAALKAIPAFETGLEAATAPYYRVPPTPPPPPSQTVWPTFLFPLADPQFMDSPSTTLPNFSQNVDPLTTLVAATLPPPPAQPANAVPLAAQTPVDPRIGWFVIRCLYERPYCGPLDPPVVSEPTPPFQMAAYFDSDAPARPLRIALPLDLSPASLRKFDKNTAFMISDQLCSQLGGLSSLTLGDLVLSVLPWPFHKDLNINSGGNGLCPPGGGGSMCTFSIPIITICAMIILLIFVKLLDIALYWMAFFRICLPFPNFKAKD